MERTVLISVRDVIDTERIKVHLGDGNDKNRCVARARQIRFVETLNFIGFPHQAKSRRIFAVTGFKL